VRVLMHNQLRRLCPSLNILKVLTGRREDIFMSNESYSNSHSDRDFGLSKDEIKFLALF
jgi:hypothetical protein